MYIYGVFRQDEDTGGYGTLIFSAEMQGPALFPNGESAVALALSMHELYGTEYDYVVYKFDLNPNGFRATLSAFPPYSDPVAEESAEGLRQSIP